MVCAVTPCVRVSSVPALFFASYAPTPSVSAWSSVPSAKRLRLCTSYAPTLLRWALSADGGVWVRAPQLRRAASSSVDCGAHGVLRRFVQPPTCASLVCPSLACLPVWFRGCVVRRARRTAGP